MLTGAAYWNSSRAVCLMAGAHRVVVLTGAGLSAESGLSTFRDPDGIWAKYDICDVATPEAFKKNPDLVHDFYNQRRRSLKGVKPNAAHHALADLERSYGGEVLVVTQNIDSLHEAAGSKSVVHMHGELERVMCLHCQEKHDWTGDICQDSHCPSCKRQGGVRPDVVWFGEMPYHMDRITRALEACTVFLSIGTSGNVYPAAGFVEIAHAAGASTIELNLEPSERADAFERNIHGPATQIVPAFVRDFLSLAN